MKVLLLALMIPLLDIASAGCPQNLDLIPCACTDSSGESTVICRGPIGLPKLTTVLRERLCGQEIDKFWLIDSDIQYLASNLFYKVRVRDIQVSFTNITHFTEAGRSAFYGLERALAFLSMRRCSLVDGLQWQKIGDLQALTYLDLSFNDLTEIPWQWFKNPPRSLRSLHLKGNRIARLQTGALSSMYNLVELDLSENLISSITRSSLPYPANNLVFLRLSYNNLTSLPEDFFNEMFGLRRFYMDSNMLKTLDDKVWSPIWGELLLLDLLGNDLECDCKMHWAAKLYPPQHLYAKCAQLNSTLDGKEVKDLWPWDFDCDEDSQDSNETTILK